MSLLRGSSIKPPSAPRCARCTKPIREPPVIRGARGDLDANDFCSASCLNEAREELSQGALRKAVFARDKGVCVCGTDCEAIRQELDALIRGLDGQEPRTWNWLRVAVHRYMRAGFPAKVLESEGETLWQAAHGTARSEGGSTRLSNATTNCLACHARDNQRLARKRKVRR